ncbi:MAG: hypothetical protein JWO03_3199 [Bacteroidetes bacterium]|nr:hypothetical protein [Bacteroidota bacterium]
MKNSLRIVLFVLFVALTSGVQAQTRYLDEVFTDVQVDTSVTYGQNFEVFTNFASLQPLIMDVYRPVGDVVTNRPLVLLSHNGSFLPEILTHNLAGLCFNGRKDSSTVELCKRFARRGYVAVSFDYRLGWSATSGVQEIRTQTIIQAVYRAMQDSKTLVRYFKNDFANSNSWGIDTGKIVIGGTNSGAYVALAAGSLNDTTELTNPKFIGSHGAFIKQDTLGSFDGFGGVQNYDNYPGISSRFECVLALGGAVGDTSWIQAGEPPVIAFQGLNESGTPYNTAVVTTTTGQPVIEVSGSGDFMPYVVAKGNNAVFGNTFHQGPPNKDGNGTITTSIEGLYPFYGKEFEPWNWYDASCYNNSQQMQTLNPGSNPVTGNLYIDTIMGYTTPRLYKMFVDPTFTSVNDIKGKTEMSLLPNPAASSFSILTNMDEAIAGINISDMTGRSVKEIAAGTSTKNIDVSALNNGIYLISIKLTDGSMATKKLTVKR